MALSHAPITELEAVNTLLQTIGEMPVSTIPTEDVTDASLAQDMLHRVNRQTQGLALKCNTDYKYAISPDGSGYINIPTNALRVVSHYRYHDYAVRERKLYDRYNQTSIFTDKVYVDITFFLTWTQLPEHVRNYITIKAARRFQAQTVGAPTLDKFSEQDEYEARAELYRWELLKHDDSIFNSPFIFSMVHRRA